MQENDPNETKHVYDGIVEENNPMPGWWVALFILCAIFGSLYWLHYTIGGGETLAEEYRQALSSYQTNLEKSEASGVAETEASLRAFMQNENAVLEGSQLFAAKCAMCHGENLEGKIGPNLTDHYWSTGNGTRMAVVNTVRKGSAAKGMPAWESMLKPAEIKKAAAFIFSKIDSKPANPKAPEGKLYE